MTEPHFIRCVVPNTHKQPGGVEPGLVMHQYQCNGVLAGIAICRKGFPNKMMYPEFKLRYNILAAKAVAKAKNDKAAAGAVMDVIALDKEKFRLGHTKVFFRAGILGLMEEFREDRIGQVLAWLQSGARGKASRMQFKKLQDQKLALYACQRAIRNFMTAKTWYWMQIWLAIKPHLKCTQFGKFKKEYEDKIALAEANIDGALEERAKVQAVFNGLEGQKNELSLALKSGGSAVQEIIDKTTRIEGQAAEVQNELAGVQNRIKGEKTQKVALEGQIGKINATVSQMEGEVKTQEGVLAGAEQDRADKDDQIKTLKDEIAHQSDMISKLGKEKRSVGDGRQKTEEDIQAAEDKCNHLSRVKGKLEQALDEAEDALEREKKVKGDVEKAKRKIEGDLKLTQEAVSDLERVKAELSGGVARKDKEGSALSAKIDDEATLAAKYAKQAKELLARLEELDEELVIERGNRAKAEKSRSMLKKDIEDISSRLEEAGSNTATQVELNKKREQELARLKGELEELNIAHEGTLAALRMKHNNTMAELGEQIDNLNGNKVKAEKDKAGLERDLADARCGLEDAVKGERDSFFDDPFFKDTWLDIETSQKNFFEKSRKRFEESMKGFESNMMSSNIFDENKNPLESSSWLFPEIFGKHSGPVFSSKDSNQIRIVDNDSKLEISLDTTGYKPDELKVSAGQGMICVEGKHEEKSEAGQVMVARQFSKKYSMPASARAEEVVSDLSQDGVLVISVPKREAIKQENRTVPIAVK